MSAPQVRYRYRVHFGKSGVLRWTGHLDLQRCMVQTLRRAALPLYYTKGFNPHPKMIFGSVLPLGLTSEAELVDLWLERPLPAAELLERLQRTAPPGLDIYGAVTVEPKAPTITVEVRSARYRVQLPRTLDPGTLGERVEQLLATPALPRQRRGKDYDLRPLVEELNVEVEGERGALSMQLASREAATGRAEEVLDQLGIDPAECLIQRTELVLVSPARSPAEADSSPAEPRS